jgi:acetylornithine deacetylase/succinyl-diaminopimelate desuccinylase-like protein
MATNLYTGHDSVFTGKRVPTTMIFVPCKNGVSHHPEEYCGPADCANGSQVLMGAVLNYDKLRASNADS